MSKTFLDLLKSQDKKIADAFGMKVVVNEHVNAEQDVLMKRFLIKFQAYALFEYRSKDFFDMKAALRDVIDAVANPTPAPPPVSSPNGDLGAP